MPFELIAPVPWPRGLCFAEDELYTLCRGRPRGAGGPHPYIEDHAGTLARVNTAMGTIEFTYPPTDPPFKLWSRQLPKHSDIDTDRPYVGLAWHSGTRNFLICCFAGIDKPTDNLKFRKNATDAVLRYDVNLGQWLEVERHDASVVDENVRRSLTIDLPNKYFPNPSAAMPRGWLNGPDGLMVHDDHLYVVGKDNHSLVRYDLSGLSGNPSAPYLPSERLRNTDLDEEKRVIVDGASTDLFDGPSSLATDGITLYVGMRTTNVVLAFPLHGPYEQATLTAQLPDGSQIIDLALSPTNRLFIATKGGTIWVTDPHAQAGGATASTLMRFTALPGALEPEGLSADVLGNLPSSGSNITFSASGDLYACCNHDGGGIYRFSNADAYAAEDTLL